MTAVPPAVVGNVEYRPSDLGAAPPSRPSRADGGSDAAKSSLGRVILAAAAARPFEVDDHSIGPEVSAPVEGYRSHDDPIR